MIHIDYSENGVWTAWRGRRPVPGQNVIQVGFGPARLIVWLRENFPQEEISVSEATKWAIIAQKSPWRSGAMGLLRLNHAS